MYIENLISSVNKTHPNLGNLVAFSQIAIKARKMALLVSPSGCGKSTAMNILHKHIPNNIMPDRISIAGLASMADSLTSFRSAIIVDDLATTQTDYARRATITTLCALVYTHRVQSMMAGYEYEIDDFYGSALIGIQPILLRFIMLSEEWDASIQDKAIRYYHLFRPLKPNLELPKIEFIKGLDIDSFGEFNPDIENRNYQLLLKLADMQFSKARAKEHICDMLKAVACLEQRKEVISSDYSLLLSVLWPMAVENAVVVKEQLEGERYLDNNLLALLVEYYTYSGQFALANVASDFKVTLQQGYKIMASQNGYWKQVSKSPTIYAPSDKLKNILKTLDLEVKK